MRLHSRHLSPEAFESLWPEVETQLDLVPWIWERWWTKASIRSNVMLSVWHAWAFGTDNADRIIVFTQFAQFPTGLVFRAFLALGNNLDSCLPMILATFQRVARDAGCIEAEIMGRPGWERKMLGAGFKKTVVVLSMPLQHFELH